MLGNGIWAGQKESAKFPSSLLPAEGSPLAWGSQAQGRWVSKTLGHSSMKKAASFRTPVSSAEELLFDLCCGVLPATSQCSEPALPSLVCYSLSSVWLFAILWTVAHQGSSVHGIFQARILWWVAISSSGGFSLPKDQTWVSCIGRQILYHLSHQGSTIPSLRSAKKPNLGGSALVVLQGLGT